MMRKSGTNVALVVLFAAIALAFPILTRAAQSKGGTQGMQGMQGMHGTQSATTQNPQHDMEKCQQEMHDMQQSHQQVVKRIQAAKHSNDPARMRSALDEAEQALTAMDRHMDTCMNNMMSNMHGAHQMQHHGSTANQPKQ